MIKTLERTAIPCSVKANGNFLRHPQLDVTFCDIKPFHSISRTCNKWPNRNAMEGTPKISVKTTKIPHTPIFSTNPDFFNKNAKQNSLCCSQTNSRISNIGKVKLTSITAKRTMMYWYSSRRILEEIEKELSRKD